jgi:hypothetical protein
VNVQLQPVWVSKRHWEAIITATPHDLRPARKGREKRSSGAAEQLKMDARHSQSVTVPLPLPDLLRSTPSSRHCKRILRHIHVLSLDMTLRHPVGARLRLRLRWLLASLL